MPDRTHKKKSLLFVCYGNICRSPMAEGFINSIYGQKLQAESAGIAARPEEPAYPDAAAIMKETYGIDLSTHRARNIDKVNPDEYDFVIALDSMVYDRLSENGKVKGEKLYGWDISDPLGMGPFAFLAAAKRIRQRIEQFLINRGLV